MVVLLYFLNLTVTNGTINGIIFYANIISINDAVFLVNDNVFKPLQVFISWIWVLRHVSIMEWMDILRYSYSCSSLSIS